MRKTLGVFFLILLLTCSVSAGEMGNDLPASQPPPAHAIQEPTTQEPTTGGEIPNGVADSMAQIALDLLALLPSLLY